ncbi:hypothetical protein BSN81_16710 [Acinetobacter baylyi]|nr:hypothetical protein BSN81_16710 [Acinetobacter baylyi]
MLLRGFSEAPQGTVGAREVERCVAAGHRVPDMEATRDRTPDAEGWGSRRGLEPGLRDGSGPVERRQGWDPRRPRISRRRPRHSRPHGRLLGGVREQALTVPGPAPGGRPADV